MQPRRRRPPPPWERGGPEPRHPLGHARRRWPGAYDGGAPAPRLNPRYRRAYDGGSPSPDARVPGGRRRRRSVIEEMRRNPVRHGLMGLAIAGTAAPVAMARYQQVVRTDPSHEQILRASPIGAVKMDETAVAQAWRAASAEAAAAAEDPREVKIREKVEQYGDLGLDRDLAADIYDIALEHEIDPDVAFGLVRTESEFKNYATSRVGAMGLTQLMPKTAKWLEPGVGEADLRNPETNLKIGFRYLRQLIDKYEGDQRLALLAYNRGPGTVDRVLKRGGDPNNGYAEAVFSGRGVH